VTSINPFSSTPGRALGLGAFVAAVAVALGTSAGSPADTGAAGTGTSAMDITAESMLAPQISATSVGADPAAEAPAAPAPVSARVASYVGALQPNGWYCGPAATRIALSAHGMLPAFDDLASALGTTRNGTNSIYDVTRVLNGIYGFERYQPVEISQRRATPEQTERLRTDVITTVNEGDIVVANIVGTVTDTAGEVHSYLGGHYVTITGYAENGQFVQVTDPADPVASNEYQVPVSVMANWIAARGYAA
jgi:hypothetical protein